MGLDRYLAKRELEKAGVEAEWDSAVDLSHMVYNVTLPSRMHPPSLANPKRVPIDDPRDGWRDGDSKEARIKAIRDLMELRRRTLTQGRPTVTQSSQIPSYSGW